MAEKSQNNGSYELLKVIFGGVYSTHDYICFVLFGSYYFGLNFKYIKNCIGHVKFCNDRRFIS